MNSSLYIIAISLLFLSFIKDKNKTKKALKKAWKALNNILLQLLFMVLLVSFLLTIIDNELILKLIGDESGWIGVIIAALVGAITLIPGFVAFPTANMLLESGAGYMQIAAFISTLMMVGVVTFPVETKFFGTKLAIYRNVLAFFFSFLVAFLIGFGA